MLNNPYTTLESSLQDLYSQHSQLMEQGSDLNHSRNSVTGLCAGDARLMNQLEDQLDQLDADIALLEAATGHYENHWNDLIDLRTFA